MSTPKSSPALRPSRRGAPEPSAALLALQERGLELPINRWASVSPQSVPSYNDSLRVSPLSILSTCSNLDKHLPLEPGDSCRRRSLSTGSAEIANILKFYTNHSEHSLKSVYEEMTPYTDESGDDDRPSLPNVHQPKAYRDTIAPLLEYQFSTERLAVPTMQSPMSIASLPNLHYPNASASVPSLQLTPDISPDLRLTKCKLGGISQTSIQITPEMTPPLPPSDPSEAPSFQQYSTSLRQRKIALEVPDVREADTWYNQPLSPFSPESLEDPLRDLQLLAVSPYGAEIYQRQLTYESLAPPATRKSPNMRPVSYVEDYLPRPISATLTHVVDDQLVPPPLDLSRSTSGAVSKIPKGSAPLHQAEIRHEHHRNEPKSQHASLVVDDPIEWPKWTYLTPPQPGNFSDIASTVPKEEPATKEIYRPGSAFSDELSYPPNPDTIGGQLKAVFIFGKKKDKSSKDASSKKKKTKSVPPHTNASSTGYQEDLESYKYPYWKSHRSAPLNTIPHPHRIQSPDVNNVQSSQTYVQEMRRLSVVSGPGPPISSSPQPPEASVDPNTTGRVSSRPPIKLSKPQPAIPVTNHQIYGVEIWNEKAKKKRQKADLKASKQTEKVAAKQAQAGIMPDPRMAPDTQLNAFLDKHIFGPDDDLPQPPDQWHSRPASSRAYSHIKTENGDTDASCQTTDAASITSSQRSSKPALYNNDLFEASGGTKKKSKFASRLMMSSEEKRKLKVKESITIVGGHKLDGLGAGAGAGLGW